MNKIAVASRGWIAGLLMPVGYAQQFHSVFKQQRFIQTSTATPRLDSIQAFGFEVETATGFMVRSLSDAALAPSTRD